MIAGVVDTHAVLWYLLGDPRISVAARRFIDDAASAGNEILVSSISLAEIVYLIEKGRLSELAYQDLKNALADPGYAINEAPLNSEIVDAMRKIPRSDVPDMPDRIVVRRRHILAYQ